MKLSPNPNWQQGHTQPFGANVEKFGVNFAVWSDHAEAIELCLFDDAGQCELQRLRMYGPTNGVFHGFLHEAKPGLIYGYRAHGKFAPDQGMRFNPHKLLLDPYARVIVGDRARQCLDPMHRDLVHGNQLCVIDNAQQALKARVCAPLPEKLRQPLRVAAADVVLYEMHVKGFSQTLPGIPDFWRGSFAALGEPAALAHLKSLGVTTLSLLPVAYALDEKHLVQSGLSNYWGYNGIGFFVPDPRLGAGIFDTRQMFRDMVDRVHGAGLEVVLDVVFNHSAEGDRHGPSLSFRGLDQLSWYRHTFDVQAQMENDSGCGNTINAAHPRVTQFILDCLRYWVQEFGVDGFRFDLATTLGRTKHGFDAQAAFFVALQQDPVLADRRLIAEPWDCGRNGYQVGHFPGSFCDWNDRFRDSMRRYWLRQGGTRAEFANRFLASSDLFHHGKRKPQASVNFVTAHDGFTLRDLTSYSRKHNETNGEGNRDGRSDELCHNFGFEGPDADAALEQRRREVRHAMLASLLLAQGTPMLLAGDEIGNSQQGNNNAYCQDNQISWLDWHHADQNTLALVQRVLRLRRELPLLRHTEWFVEQGRGVDGPSARWRSPRGEALTVHDWHNPLELGIACELFEATQQRALLKLLFNPSDEPADFVLDIDGDTDRWQTIFSTALAECPSVIEASLHVRVPPCAVLVLQRQISGVTHD